MTTPLDARGLPEGYPFRPQYEITPREAKALLERGACFIVDCRTEEEWDTSRVEGTAHIPLAELELRADEIEPPPGAVVLTLCHHGRRSLTAAMLLQARGFAEARSIVGGIDLWALDIDPSVPRYTKENGNCTPIT